MVLTPPSPEELSGLGCRHPYPTKVESWSPRDVGLVVEVMTPNRTSPSSYIRTEDLTMFFP